MQYRAVAILLVLVVNTGCGANDAQISFLQTQDAELKWSEDELQTVGKLNELAYEYTKPADADESSPYWTYSTCDAEPIQLDDDDRYEALVTCNVGMVCNSETYAYIFDDFGDLENPEPELLFRLNAQDIQPIDIDSDGKSEILTGSYTLSDAPVYLGLIGWTGSMAAPMTSKGTEPVGCGFISRDVDQDGVSEIFAAPYSFDVETNEPTTRPMVKGYRLRAGRLWRDESLDEVMDVLEESQLMLSPDPEGCVQPTEA